MKISRNFVVMFLVCFLLVILGNVTALALDFYKKWMLYALLSFLFIFLVLFFRKRVNSTGEETKTTKIIKLLFTLIPILIIGYVLYANLIASHDFNYQYDIGGLQDTKKPYLTPLNRMSDIDNVTSSRNITSGLVYYDVVIPRGSDNISVQLRILDNFPVKSNLKIGGKNQSNWSYYYATAYDSKINNKTNGQWIVVNATFGLKDLYISNGKLNMLININHLGKNATQNYTIPIDWIKIDIHKNGLFEKSN